MGFGTAGSGRRTCNADNQFGSNPKRSTNNSKRYKINLKIPNITYNNNFIDRTEADAIFDKLIKETPWKQKSMYYGGKRVVVPRLTCWYGDNNTEYTYSGIKNNPLPWTHLLKGIRDICCEITQESFNSVLLNYYRDGKDGVAWHSDSERNLGLDPIIASVSFGAERVFSVREKVNHNKYKYLLEHGSLLIMGSRVQLEYDHAIMKQANIGPRINLTFRYVFPK